MNVAE